jgi:hypothetical protein
VYPRGRQAPNIKRSPEDSHELCEEKHADRARHREPPARRRLGGRGPHSRRSQCRGAEVPRREGQEGRRLPVQGPASGRAAGARAGADPSGARHPRLRVLRLRAVPRQGRRQEAVRHRLLAQGRLARDRRRPHPQGAQAGRRQVDAGHAQPAPLVVDPRQRAPGRVRGEARLADRGGHQRIHRKDGQGRRLHAQGRQDRRAAHAELRRDPSPDAKDGGQGLLRVHRLPRAPQLEQVLRRRLLARRQEWQAGGHRGAHPQGAEAGRRRVDPDAQVLLREGKGEGDSVGVTR